MGPYKHGPANRLQMALGPPGGAVTREAGSGRERPAMTTHVPLGVQRLVDRLADLPQPLATHPGSVFSKSPGPGNSAPATCQLETP